VGTLFLTLTSNSVFTDLETPAISLTWKTPGIFDVMSQFTLKCPEKASERLKYVKINWWPLDPTGELTVLFFTLFSTACTL